MSRRIAFPSDEFPPPVSLDLEVPEQWEPLTVPGVQVAIAEPRVEGCFRANVVITVQRVAADFTMERAEESLGERKAALPGLEEIGTGQIEIEGRSWLASEYGYTQPGHPTIVQAARYAVVRRSADATDVVEVVASCGGEDADEAISALRAIQDSVRIEG